MSRYPRILVAAPLMFAALAIGACGGEPELEFADWLLPVPEGTPVKEYGPIPLDERDENAVQLIDDLVIGGDSSDPDTIFYQPTGVVASADGNIFVGDYGNNHIRMFDRDGKYLKTLGKEGQGPGEFASLAGITIAGDKLVVNDPLNRRFSVWTLDGEHVADHAPTSRVSATSMQGLSDGSIVSMFTERTPEGDASRVLVRRTIEGEEVSRLLQFALPPSAPISLADIPAFAQTAIDQFNDPRIIMTVGSRGIVYVSPVHEYQVLALSEAGDTLWALRVLWPRPPYPETAKQSFLDVITRQFEAEVAVDDFDWPEHSSGLSTFSTDGAGRLYVFPQVAYEGEEPPEIRPVDVYSPAGDLLAAGLVSDRWTYALGDYVYGLRADELDEMVVVRYRIVLNEQ